MQKAYCAWLAHHVVVADQDDKMVSLIVYVKFFVVNCNDRFCYWDIWFSFFFFDAMKINDRSQY